MAGDAKTANDATDSGTDLSRRDFGRVVGGAAAAVTLQALSGDVHAAQPSAQGSIPAHEALCDLGSVELAARIRRKDVSAREAMTAHLARIERINPRLNAIVTLVADRAMADAARADEQTARGGPLGPLHGLPMAHKDLVDTAGIRTTRTAVVVGDRAAEVEAAVRADWPGAGHAFAVQAERLGTGHATLVARPCIAPDASTVVVAYGDTPLLQADTVARLVEAHHAASARVSLVTGDLDDPTGYGRILRDPSGHVTGIDRKSTRLNSSH